jgi:hypothetical protein
MPLSAFELARMGLASEPTAGVTSHFVMAAPIRDALAGKLPKGTLANVPASERADHVPNPAPVIKRTRNGRLMRYQGAPSPGANSPVRVPSVNPYPGDRDRPNRPGRGNRGLPAGVRPRAGFVPDMATPAPDIAERHNVFESTAAPEIPADPKAREEWFRAQRPAGEGKQQSTTRTYGVRDLRNPGGQRPKSSEPVVFVRGRGMNARRDRTRAERDLAAQQSAAVEFERMRAEQGARDALIATGRALLATAIAERHAAKGDARKVARANDKIRRAEQLIKMQGGKV